MKLPPFLTALARAFTWHRRWFAAVLVGIAVLAAINAVSGHSGDDVAVVVAARTIPPGTKLTAADVSAVRLPRSAIPDGAPSAVEPLVGAETVVEIPARAAITPQLLLTAGPVTAPGKVAVPVRFGDGQLVSVLSVGSHIDIFGTANGGVATIASDVRVVAIPNAERGSGFTSASNELVLVEVDPTQAATIASAASAASLSFALR